MSLTASHSHPDYSVGYSNLKNHFNLLQLDSKVTWHSHVLSLLIYHRASDLALVKIDEALSNERTAKECLNELEVKKITLPIIWEVADIPEELGKKWLEMQEASSTPCVMSIKTLTSKMTPFALTPLHIATIMQDVRVVTKLLEVGVYVDEPDFRSWTAAHHAALHPNRTILNALLLKGANSALRNCLDGTCTDLWNLVHPLEIPSVNFWDAASMQVVKKDATYFRAATKAQFSAEMVTSPKSLLKNWVAPPAVYPVEGCLQKRIKAQYDAFQAASPTLCLQKQSHNDQGKLVGDIGWGVYAGQDLHKGRIVCEYVGQDIESEQSETKAKRESEYVLDQIDASKIKGYAAFINDSFPNCMFMSISCTRGLKDRVLVIALEDIPQGQPLYIDYYSGHACKLRTHVELRMGAMRSFAAMPKFKELVMHLRSLTSAGAIYDSPSCDEISQLTYIASTPASLIYLMCEDILSLEDFNWLLKMFPHPQLKHIQGAVESFFSQVPKQSAPVSKALISWLKERLNEDTQISLCSMDNLGDAFQCDSSSIYKGPGTKVDQALLYAQKTWRSAAREILCRR